MINDDYDIDFLIETFTIHAEKSRNEFLKDQKKFPDADHFEDKNYFNIAKALLIICQEIKELKSK
jgi:hypothetical protein